MRRLDIDINADEDDFYKENWLRVRNSGHLKWRGKSLKDMTDEELNKAYGEWLHEDRMLDEQIAREDYLWR
ncbi:MAG: hypothetical protein J6S85_10395 [Methanobrevibacter sp.]|nr:hypothetical protein [Methanobrevibacter sp.]